MHSLRIPEQNGGVLKSTPVVERVASIGCLLLKIGDPGETEENSSKPLLDMIGNHLLRVS